MSRSVEPGTVPATGPEGLQPARWDGRRMLFEVEDQGRAIACAISLNALQDLSERRFFKPPELMACFVKQRARIEALALAKLRGRNPAIGGVVSIWADDIDDPPPAAEPDAAIRTPDERAA